MYRIKKFIYDMTDGRMNIWPTIVMIVVGLNTITRGDSNPLWWWWLFFVVVIINIPLYIIQKIRQGKGK